MSTKEDLLSINIQDEILSTIFKKNIQYTNIQGDVNLCVKRCGFEIDGCDEVYIKSVENHGKILLFTPDSTRKSTCKVGKTHGSKDDASYEFEKLFVTAPAFHKVDGVMYECELGIIFSKESGDGKGREYMVMSVVANSANVSNMDSLNDSGDLLFYKLTESLFTNIPSLSNKAEIKSPPNPISLANFFPPTGSRSFYEYSYDYAKSVTYRVFQRPMMISSAILAEIQQKMMERNAFEEYKSAIQTHENEKKGLIIFYKEDLEGAKSPTPKEEREYMENQDFLIENTEPEPSEPSKPKSTVEHATVSEKTAENTVLKTYVITIMTILFLIIIHLYKSYLFSGSGNSGSGNRIIQELLGNTSNDRTKYTTHTYFIATIANLLFILLSFILTIFLIFVGTAHNFSQTSLTESSDFNGLLASITAFVSASIFTLFVQIVSRLLLPHNRFEDICAMDTFLNIDALRKYIYIRTGMSSGVSEECIDASRFTLSYEVPGAQAPVAAVGAQPGAAESGNIFDNIKRIFKPKSNIYQIWILFILYSIFILFPFSTSIPNDTPIYYAYYVIISAFVIFALPIFAYYKHPSLNLNEDTISWVLFIIILSLFAAFNSQLKSTVIATIGTIVLLFIIFFSFSYIKSREARRAASASVGATGVGATGAAAQPSTAGATRANAAAPSVLQGVVAPPVPPAPAAAQNSLQFLLPDWDTLPISLEPILNNLIWIILLLLFIIGIILIGVFSKDTGGYGFVFGIILLVLSIIVGIWIYVSGGSSRIIPPPAAPAAPAPTTAAPAAAPAPAPISPTNATALLTGALHVPPKRRTLDSMNGLFNTTLREVATPEEDGTPQLSNVNQATREVILDEFREAMSIPAEVGEAAPPPQLSQTARENPSALHSLLSVEEEESKE